MTRNLILSDETVMSKICFIRNKKVILDSDLAALYQVETKYLKRQVKRNQERFPDDFMFTLTKTEYLRCQIGTSKAGGTRYLPMAFTEQGVAMLSSVLGSKKAISVNIQIIRVFTRMRELLMTHKDLLARLEKLEKSLIKQDQYVKKHEADIIKLIKVLRELIQEPAKPRTLIGYRKKRD